MALNGLKNVVNNICCGNFGIILHFMASLCQSLFCSLFICVSVTFFKWIVLLPWQEEWDHSISSFTSFQKNSLFLTLTLYRRIFQFLEGSNLAFALKEQYLNNYKRYHHVGHTVGKVFSLRIQRRKVLRKTFSNT